jgi:hypothetical protein
METTFAQDDDGDPELAVFGRGGNAFARTTRMTRPPRHNRGKFREERE